MSVTTVDAARPDPHLSDIAEFERNLISERVNPLSQPPKSRGRKLATARSAAEVGQARAPKVLALIEEGRGNRWIAHNLAISKNTVADIAKRNRASYA